MLELYPKLPINIKRRAVAVVRSFPEGCGFKATKLEANHSAERNPQLEPLNDSESLGAEACENLAENIVKNDALDLLEPAHDEGVKVNGQVRQELLSLKKRKHGVSKEDEPRRLDKFVGGDVEDLMSSSKKCENGDVVESANDSERFLVKKRRKAAIVRQFPPGCGRGVSNIGSKGADSETIHVGFSENNCVVACRETRVEATVQSSFVSELHEKAEDVVEKKDGDIVRSLGVRGLDGKQIKPDVRVLSAKVIVSEIEQRNESDQVSGKVTKETTIRSSKVKNLIGDMKEPVEGEAKTEKFDQIKEKANSEVSREDIVNSPDSKGFTSKKKKNVEAEDLSAESIKDEAKRDGSNQIHVKAKVVKRNALTKIKSLDGKRKPLVKQKSETEGSLRVSSDAKVETELKKNYSKKIKEDAGECSGEVHVKSPLNARSSYSMSEEHYGEKSLIRYSSQRRFERYDVEQVRKTQIKGSRDPRSSYEADNVGKSLVVKPVDEGSVEGPMYVTPLKRKSPDEVDDESLECYGDKLVVQPLLSAENCLWRKGKRSNEALSHSATPRIKVKKEWKSLRSKSASVSCIVSKSQRKNTGYMQDESLPLDGGNEKALTKYKGSPELCITMIPSVPSGSYCKGSCSRSSSSSEDVVYRNRVKKALRLFQLVSRKLLQGEEAKSNNQGRIKRVDLAGARILKKNNEWVHYGEAFIGHVPGVEVGDEFQYRVELSIVGIHRPFQAGIDFTKRNGTVLATSIVASGGYPDDIDSSGILIYSGSGDKEAGDQKLERGNLALKNSIDAQTPVRVVYGSKEHIKGDSRDTKAKSVSTLTYDGLYLVEDYWPDKGYNKYKVFKFQLRKIPGQPEIALKELKRTKKLAVREGLCVNDISGRKESMPICAINTVDDTHPPYFKYITKVIYPSRCINGSPRGCNCKNGCSDSEKCACTVKNGGEIPFNFNGAIVQAKALVFECGPSCKCPPSCHNRVSQHGIRLPLEIFKTKTRGWGVRSLYSIPSGTFICEYIGMMLDEAEADQRVNDEYLFDIGHNYDDHALWDGLPSIIPGMQSSAARATVEDVGFTIDAAEYGNVGRFINHSCSPNLYAQNVLYDHDDKRMPHIMFFAIDNIPPLQELTYHYNYKVDQVRDSEGNIKKKECYCGSRVCTGRLY